MKKAILVILCVLVIITLSSAIVFAEGETTGTTTTSNEITTQPVNTTEQEAGTTPDSILYPFEKLIESVQLALTFSADGKAELLISFANERLAEAQIMTERNKQELVEKVMNTYIKTVQQANKNIENAAQDDKDVVAILEDVKIVEETAEKILIKATGIIPQEYAESLKLAIENEVKKTLAVSAFTAAKMVFAEAREKVNVAREELATAQKSGDEAVIKAAEDKLTAAEQYKEQMEKLKDEIEAYKEEIKSVIKEQEKILEDDKDKDEKSDLIKEPGDTENIEKKIEKMDEIIIKQQEKRDEMISKLSERPGKAAAKIEENTKKQIEKKNVTLEELKESLSAAQESTTVEQNEQSSANDVTILQDDEENEGTAIGQNESADDKGHTDTLSHDNGNGKSKK